jgi:hypothetical protein
MTKRHLFSFIHFMAVPLLLLSASLQAQNFNTPIAGNIYGQAIVTCSSSSPLEYAATGTTIYERPPHANDYYQKVWTAPGTLHITSFSVKHQNGNYYRAVLLKDGSSNFYVAYNKIRSPAPDSAITAPVLLPPPYIGTYAKVVAGGSLHVFSFLSGGPAGNLIISRDNGLTWQPDTLGIGYDNVYDIATDTSQNAVIAGVSGIYRQPANDSAWSLLNSNTNSASLIFVDQMGRIVTTNYGINTYISTDGGSTFAADNTGLSYQIKYLADDASGNLYAVNGNIFRNAGGTGTWVNISTGFNAVANSAQITGISGDSVLTIGTSLGMFTGADSGAIWAATNNGIHAEDIYSLITQADGRLVCTTDLGIFYKDAADTLWHPTNPITTFYPGNLLYNDPAGNIFVAVSPTFGPPYPLGRSTDNGLNFTVDSNGFSAIGGGAFYMDETGARHFYNYYATSSDPFTVWTSALGSSVWSLDTLGLPVFPIYGTGVKDMCSDHRGYLYASVDMPAGDILYRRPIAGAAWTADTMGIGASSIISPMASDASLGLVVASGMDCYRRAASGWVALSPVPGASGNGGINALSIDANAVIYLSYSNYSYPDSNAVYYSKDSGMTWHLAGLTGLATNSLVSKGDTTYALTYGNWGYVYSAHGLNGITTLPAAHANNIKVFPNPSASGIWTIQTNEEWIGSQLEIYDVSGRKVYQSVIDKSNMQINAQNLSSGIYVLRISNDANTLNSWLVK